MAHLPALFMVCTLLTTALALPPPSGPSPSPTQACHGLTFPDNQVYATCNDLPRLSSYLYWNYYPTNQTANIAFRKTGTSTSNWIAWALNPGGQMMAGSQALVAYQDSNGSMVAYTTSVTGSPTMKPGNLSFGVSNLRAEYSDGEMIIFATLQLDSTLLSTNQVWQEGPMQGGSPGMHDISGDNILSFGTVNFATGTVTSGGGISSKALLKNVHGILNAIGWGILMPIGAILARYLKVFKSVKVFSVHPAWYDLHRACQIIAFCLGVAGWGIGIKLGSVSRGINFSKHKKIGIALLCMAAVQVGALIRKPNPNHKYRIYWTIYHHSLGYAIIILSIINIFEGFNISKGQNYWKWTYAGIIIALGAVALLLEILTWLVVIRRKRLETTNTKGIGTDGVDGVNGSVTNV
ncbi:hypothetical protein Tsubulata_008073 [Turnera subulata]|uniref:Cytochrome b561 and DOMON domain-containing protein n=1 Tax=Turnera subulata TaxID=218843 RepID=A0A9Q0FNC2_9ROSI|nr:hypothetical protein Tsubulata_008073 [Turnera subulata]